MTTDNNVNQLIINQLTKIQYKELVDNNTLSENELYVITDEVHYTDDELKTLLQTKQDVLTASGKISIDNNIITVDLSDYNTIEEINTKLKDYVKLEDNLYIIKNKTDFIKLDTSNIGKIESIRYINDQTYPSNLIIINNKLYCITGNDDNYTLTEITTTGSTQADKWIKISANYDSVLGSFNSSRNFGIDSTGKLFSIYNQSYNYLSNISDNWTDISGFTSNKYRHAYGINNGELYGITYESNQFVFTKISDYNDWTNVCGWSDSNTKAYGIRNGLLYRILANNTFEQVEAETGWVKIYGCETTGVDSVGLKNGVLQIVNNTGVTPVNTYINGQPFTIDMSNAEFNTGLNPSVGGVIGIFNENEIYYLNTSWQIQKPIFRAFEMSGHTVYNLTFIGNYDNSNSHNLYRQGQIGSGTNWKYVYSFDDTYLVAYLSNPFYNENDINDKLQEIVNDLDSKISTKQDIITDLDDIRDGANKGSTALQTEVDPIYTADKPNIALKSEVNDLDSKINILDTKVDTKQDILTAGKGIEISNNIVSSNIQGVPIGTVYPCLCTANYIPEGALPCNGSEYTKGQFTDLWNNYLMAETPLLPTCTYSEYKTAINTYGSCTKFGITTGEKLNPDYTYIGDLNVDSNGIANNFNSSDYATVPVSFTLTPESNFYYKARVKLYKDTSGGVKRCITAFYYGDTLDNSELQLSYLGDNPRMQFYFYLGYTVALIHAEEYFNEGDWVTVEYIKNGTTFTTKVTNDLGETHEATTENVSVKTKTYTLARIGKGDDGASDYYKSDIDLSSVLIKVDDVEIFNGTKINTFKVPTIKPNKTLIYSGTGTYTTYRIYSDGFCEQWGKITVSANGANTATFDWSFKDTNYYLECAGYNTAGTDTAGYTVQNSAYWNKTTTGFTCFGLVNKPKPFYACGYINTNASLFQTYFNNTEINRYFVQVTNGTINQSQMNWSQYASALQGKSNTDLNNLSDTGKKVIDGQWVNKTQILSSDTNIGVYTLDLSEYLPSDNYIYEVELFGHVRCDNSNPVTFIINDTYSISTKNSIGSLQQIYLTIPVLPTDRTIKKEIQKVKCTSTVLTAIRYRRIGTNE